MRIGGKRGKSKGEVGYGEGCVRLSNDDDVLVDEDEMVSRLIERFNSPNYSPPKLPGTATELMALAGKADVTIDDIVALMEQDTMLTGQVMKIVQSPMYAGSVKITSLSQALVRIGLNTLRDLVLQASMNMRVFRADAYTETMDRLRKHSVMTAHLSRIVAKHASVEAEYAFLCGLMHDVGIAATLIALSDAGPKKKAPDLVAVWPAIDRVHAQAGQLIGQLWELPEEIQNVIGLHHQVLRQGEPDRLSAVVCIADDLAHALGFWLTPAEDQELAGVSELEAACLVSHGKVDQSQPRTLEQAKEALGLGDEEMKKIRRDAAALEEGLGQG